MNGGEHEDLIGELLEDTSRDYGCQNCDQSLKAKAASALLAQAREIEGLKQDRDAYSASAGARVSAAPPTGCDLESVWVQAADNHRRYSATGSAEDDIRFLTLGLTGEAGELANFIKKRWRDGDGHEQAIRYEIADVCAYAFMLAQAMEMTPAALIGTIAEKQRVFIEKMAARTAPTDGDSRG